MARSLTTALLRTYAVAFPPFRHLAILVKAWAGQRGLNTAHSGTLSSYAHVLSVLHYCQAACDPPICPDLQAAALTSVRPIQMCDGVDVRFCDDVALARHFLANQRDKQSPGGLRTEEPPPPPPLTSLLRGFFGYLRATAAGPHTLTVRGRDAGAFLLDKRQCWPLEGKRQNSLLDGRISIEDPFEVHDSPEPTRRHDVAATVSEPGMQRLLTEWQRGSNLLQAAEALEAGGDTDGARAKMLELFAPVAQAE